MKKIKVFQTNGLHHSKRMIGTKAENFSSNNLLVRNRRLSVSSLGRPVVIGYYRNEYIWIELAII